MIDIFLCPEQDSYYSAIEGKPKQVHAESIRICESLLREMSTKASWHRFVVMESLVAICSGKKNLDVEEIIKRLVDVLTVVTYHSNIAFRVSSRNACPCHCQVHGQKRH